MNFQIKRNLQFTKLVKAEGRLREFNFTRLTGLMDGIFSLDVVDDRGNRIIFQMKKSDEEWQINEAELPNWIIENKLQFKRFIEEELNEDQKNKVLKQRASDPSE